MPRFEDTDLNHYLYGYNTVRLATQEEIDAELAERMSSLTQQSPRSGVQSQPWRLPKEITICISGIPGSILGICTIQAVSKGTWFGPLEGRSIGKESHVRATTSEFMWEVFQDGNVSHYLDGKDVLSWMSYVRCARHTREQNLVMSQYCGCIYYRALCDIPVGKELLVWYHEKYTQMLGIPMTLNEAKAHPVRDLELMSSNPFPIKYRGKQVHRPRIIPKRPSPFIRPVYHQIPKTPLDSVKVTVHHTVTQPRERIIEEHTPHVVRISSSRYRDIAPAVSRHDPRAILLNDQMSQEYNSRLQTIDVLQKQYYNDMYNSYRMPIISRVTSRNT